MRKVSLLCFNRRKEDKKTNRKEQKRIQLHSGSEFSPQKAGAEPSPNLWGSLHFPRDESAASPHLGHFLSLLSVLITISQAINGRKFLERKKRKKKLKKKIPNL